MAPPVSFPLTSLEQLADGSLFSSDDYPFLRRSVQLDRRMSLPSSGSRSKLLVCHDMKGGYQDDKFVQGNDNSKAYSLWHWQCIDVFVYFSHSLVTVPPPCWINAAHLHGVPVLGTFITEWEQGENTCKRLLASKESARMYAFKLADIAFKLGFEGWLLNFENKISVEHMPVLIDFVQQLTVQMHKLVPGSQVIWYDAVTVDGNLAWQNVLNDKNKPFFDVCNGIFINYTWKKSYPRKSAEFAGSRAPDVYMGVDVFGRDTYGGGKYQTNLALKASLEAGVSSAMFAPGWLYETNQGPTFEDAQIKFWASIHEAWPIAHQYPVALPFFTDFSQGVGEATYMDGAQVSSRPWSNISCQNLQPLLNATSDGEAELGSVPAGCRWWRRWCSTPFEAAVRWEDKVYSGGSSMRFSGEIQAGEVRSTKLYSCSMPLTATAPLDLSFSVFSRENFPLSIVLRTAQGIEQTAFCFFESSTKETRVVKLEGEITPGVHGLDLLNATVVPPADHSSWVMNNFSFTVDGGSRITAIYALSYIEQNLDYVNLARHLLSERTASYRQQHRKSRELGSKAYEAHLGHLKLTNSVREKERFEPKRFDAVKLKWEVSNTGDRFVSLNLQWSFEQQHFSRYSLFCRQGGGGFSYLGVTFVNMFYVERLPVLTGGGGIIEFYLQPRNNAGDQKRLEELTPLVIHVPTTF